MGYVSGCNCCFCGAELKGIGNSTWPVYWEETGDGERNRCCDRCNSKYVIPCRQDKTLIMRTRELFGISYEEYTDDKKN